MERAVIVKGRVTDSRHIELDEPVEGMTGNVEITMRRVPTEESEEDVLDFLRRLPRGTRTKAEIDRYLEEERASWERPEGWPWKREP
jgi:hypothetical protein